MSQLNELLKVITDHYIDKGLFTTRAYGSSNYTNTLRSSSKPVSVAPSTSRGGGGGSSS